MYINNYNYNRMVKTGWDYTYNHNSISIKVNIIC